MSLYAKILSYGVFTAYSFLLVDLLPSISRRTSAPTFEKKHFEAAVRENGEAQQLVTTIKAFNGAPPLTFTFGGHGRRPFNIHAETGQVITRASLDYELRTSYQLPLAVRDAAGRQAFASLEINVIDENDNAPKFVASRYTVAVPSNATQGHVILRLLARDPDAGDKVEYSMFQADSSEDLWKHFKLHRRRGQLTIRRSLQKLEGKKINFFVRAIDGGNPPLKQEVPVELFIVSRDQLVPKFVDEMFQFSVLENVQIGFNVGELALKDNIGSLKYSIIPATNEEDLLPFSVDDAGRLSTVEELDRESRDEYQFSVAASSVDDSSLAAVALITIRLEDVNDNAPRFEANYEKLEIGEDAPVGTSLAVISASDPDHGKAAEIEFSIEGEEAYGMFKIDAETGWLQLDAPLDRETNDKYHFTVIVKDHGTPRPLSSSTEITVTVTDSNDRAPEFERETYQFKIEESSLPGTVLGHLVARDLDLPPNVTELFITDGDEEGYFGLNDTGELYVKRMLDYETQIQHKLTVVASDGRHSDSTTAIIDVVDTNDNAPVCEMDLVKLRLAENVEIGSEVFILVADDPDSGENSELNYELEGINADHFQINTRGTLSVAEPLDRETIAKYELKLKAIDIGRLSCETIIHLILTDVNDCPPIFSKSVYEVSVMENLDSDAHFLLRVSAVDQDLGAGGKVQYALTNVEQEIQQTFFIDVMTGALTIRKTLDRELRAFYNLTVMALDQDPNIQLKSTGKIRFWKYVMAVEQLKPFFGNRNALFCDPQILVKVLDENDNPPVFERKEYEATISEAEVKGFELLILKAISADSEENSKIRYHILAADQALDSFSIDQYNGHLTLRKQLDFETQSSYNLTVEAVDSGDPPLSSTVSVKITVLDENDNPPQFTQSLYEAEIAENAEIGTSVVQVKAHDLDHGANGRIQYKLVHESDPDNPFIVGEDGRIVVEKLLDREKKSEYRLLVKALDGGDPPSSSTVLVKITVLDENDNPPQFTQSQYEAKIAENAEIGTSVVQVKAHDLDHGANGRIQYKLVHESDPDNPFIVGEDGRIVVEKLLDREKKSEYRLLVEAQDGGDPPSSSTVLVKITVLDENDNPPQFTQSLYEAEIAENAEIGTSVVQVKAHDLDHGTNGRIQYKLVHESDPDNPFIVGEDGRIVVETFLDREKKSEYRLLVEALDGGDPPSSSTVLVKITVLDENDNPPQFTQSLYEAEIAENAEIGTSVVQVKAHDLDHGANGRIQYKLVHEIDPDNAFIVGEDGRIVVEKLLDREKKSEYRLLVEAQDSGDPPLSSTVSVKITVLDENDNPPQFTQSLYEAEIAENAEIGTSVVQVKAHDLDHGTNGRIQYKLVHESDPDNPFIVGEDGRIVVEKFLDREKKSEYRLLVEALDGGDPPSSSTVLVKITVLDENDHPPQFTQSLYEAEIAENAEIGTSVVQVKAHDLDHGANGRIQYKLVHEIDPDNAFIVGEDGRIVVEKLLDREKKSEYRLLVEARDGGELSKTDSAIVSIHITDVNDNSPIFENCNLTAFIQESAPIGRELLSVSVTDADTDENARPFRFEIAGSGEEKFRIDLNGTLRTKAKLKYSEASLFLLTLKISTSGEATVSVVGSGAPLRFLIKAIKGEYIDPNHLVLSLKFKVWKKGEDGAKTLLPGGEKVAPYCGFLYTMFKDVMVDFNGITVYTTHQQYQHLAYLGIFLNAPHTMKDSVLEAALWKQDLAGGFDLVDPANKNINPAAYWRAQSIKKSKEMEIKGPLLIDCLKVGKPILDGVDIGLSFFPTGLCFMPDLPQDRCSQPSELRYRNPRCKHRSG